jgi:hypothetical protein
VPVLALLLITPVLTELLTGNTPAPVFFQPRTFFFLMVFYGIPAVLARELHVRWKLSLPGLFVLGLAYGIFNEGVLAKTLLMDVHVPIDAFDHHAWLGINFPWVALIVPWHAWHAIVFPIALVSWWFPDRAHTPSLSRLAFAVLAVIVSFLGITAYLGNKQHVTSPVYLVIFISAMAALIATARWIKQGGTFLGPGPAISLWPAAAGFSFYPVNILCPTFLAGLKAPSLVILALSVTLLVLYFRLLLRHRWLGLSSFVFFALGSYLAGTVWGCLFALKKGYVLGVLPEILLMLVFAFGMVKLAKGNYSRATA